MARNPKAPGCPQYSLEEEVVGPGGHIFGPVDSSAQEGTAAGTLVPVLSAKASCLPQAEESAMCYMLRGSSEHT